MNYKFLMGTSQPWAPLNAGDLEAPPPLELFQGILTPMGHKAVKPPPSYPLAVGVLLLHT